MTWPTDDLSKTHFDAGADIPASARAQIEALYDKVKLMLAEVGSGETVFHSGNDGPTSGLSAQYLGGQDSAFHRNASNLNAGTVPLARLPSGIGQGFSADLLDDQHGDYYLDLSNHTGEVNSSQIGADQVGQSEIGTGQVGQTELKTASAEQSDALNNATDKVFNFVLAHGEYSFAPEVRGDSLSWYMFGNLSTQLAYNNTAYGGVYVAGIIETGGTWSTTVYAKSRYVTASPPHKIGNLDFGPFLFLTVNKDGSLKRTSIADDPPWYFEGPTNIRPDRVAKGGKKFKKVRILPDNFETLPKQLQLIAKARAPIEEVEITTEFKNKDMGIIPHPFTHGELKEGQTVLIIEPDDKCYSDIMSLRDQGESIADLIHSGYLKIGPESKSKDCPDGVCMHKLNWKLT